jgi:hypothetical protein
MFTITSDHQRWAKSAARKYGHTKAYWLELIAKQRGLCGFSDTVLLFDAESGTPKKGGEASHPIYAVIDHCAPGCDDRGHEIVCYDLNDLKGNLPFDCFKALRATPAGLELMSRWRAQAEKNPADREAFLAARRWLRADEEAPKPAGNSRG